MYEHYAGFEFDFVPSLNYIDLGSSDGAFLLAAGAASSDVDSDSFLLRVLYDDESLSVFSGKFCRNRKCFLDF